jgi:redox-sensitive bicupin YhaK (pirin superfamily)
MLEGGGFPVRRPFPTPELADIDPFLLLDEMGPVDWPPGEAIGAPDHPHRGFETVTYMLKGKMQHRDSAGNAGVLEPGDVQWMTAGAGVVHSELPEPAFLKSGGWSHGFQLWVNLPAKMKMTKPRYQEMKADQLPIATSPDGKVWARVIAGEALGVKAVIDTHTPIAYIHFAIEPGGRVTQALPAGFTSFVYVFGGEIAFGNGEGGAEPRIARDGQVAVLGEGEEVTLSVPASATGQRAEALVLGGQPIREPVARYGPFVMNTPAEIQQAFADYQNGRFGVIG